MSVKRRACLGAVALAAPALLLGPARGQGLPREKDLRIFVGFEQGGGADSVGRAIAVELQRRTSRRVIVENRTGQHGAMPGESVGDPPTGVIRHRPVHEEQRRSRPAAPDRDPRPVGGLDVERLHTRGLAHHDLAPADNPSSHRAVCPVETRDSGLPALARDRGQRARSARLHPKCDLTPAVAGVRSQFGCR